MKVVYFFRRPLPQYHSIEELFKSIQEGLGNRIDFENVFAPLISRGPFSMLWNAIQAFRNQGSINHITGDIHYVALLLKKKRTILTIHDIGSILKGSQWKRRLFKYLWFTMPINRVQLVTVISEFTKMELQEKIGIRSDKIRVVCDCVSPAIKYIPRTTSQSELTILQIGTKANKNIENLIVALKGTQHRLHIVGRLSEQQIRLLEDNGVRYENYHNISFDKLLSLYENCDLVAFISLYEGFGMPIIEANAMGRPVITSTAASMPEIAGDAALLVDPNNVDEIRAGINELAENEQLRQQLVDQGLVNVKRFQPSVIASQYLALYKELLNNH